MMKQKITNPNKGVEFVAEEKPCDHAVSYSAKEIDALNIYWFPYSYPFVPIMDLTFVFDELRKMVKNWFLNKRERTIIYKKKMHGTI
jgi:hypothetical protein